ncbi:MAG: hypothetical protein KIS67_01315 [Verrucomicrobiae bacterium]|nr:hypothetical protein [Verrucomicrobiae bacterium]
MSPSRAKPVRRRAALMVFKLSMDSKVVVMRFETERLALAMMKHPNFASVPDSGTTVDGFPGGGYAGNGTMQITR